MLNIKYDLVGSFLRPTPIKAARASNANGEISLCQLRRVEDAAISKPVETEATHGLKFVTDGEYHRRW